MPSLVLKSLWARKRRAVGASIAVIIGIAFLSATMILGNAMTAGLDGAITEAFDGVDVEVRSVVPPDLDSFVVPTVDAAVLDQLAVLPEVAVALPSSPTRRARRSVATGRPRSARHGTTTNGMRS